MSKRAALELLLENEIDKHGLTEVLEAIESVANDKATHIQENWQDEKLARQWRYNAGEIGHTARKLL